MFIKIETSASFCGSETTHLVEVNDNLTEEEINELVDSYVEDDIAPTGYFEILSDEEKEEMEEDGYEVE